MKIEVRFRGLESSDSLREHAARRALGHLSRFGDQVTAVLVRVADLNGPKGGVDKRCQVTLTGRPFGTATLSALSPDPYAAVDLAVDRIAHAVGRQLERRRRERRRQPAALRVAW